MYIQVDVFRKKFIPYFCFAAWADSSGGRAVRHSNMPNAQTVAMSGTTQTHLLNASTEAPVYTPPGQVSPRAPWDQSEIGGVQGTPSTGWVNLTPATHQAGGLVQQGRQRTQPTCTQYR